MSFADELRNTKVVTKEDKWRRFGRNVAYDLKNKIQDTCRSAARNGARSATVSVEYATHHHMDVDFPIETESFFGIFEKKGDYNYERRNCANY